MQQGLNENEELRKQIGNAIQKDVEEELTTELGGLVRWNADGSIAFDYLPSEHNFSNGAYRMPQRLKNHAVGALGTTHQHALKYNNADSASPSGSMFRMGADVSVAAIFKVDGVLITSIKKGQFAVHFYNERKDVVFVGVYDY